MKKDNSFFLFLSRESLIVRCRVLFSFLFDAAFLKFSA